MSSPFSEPRFGTKCDFGHPKTRASACLDLHILTSVRSNPNLNSRENCFLKFWLRGSQANDRVFSNEAGDVARLVRAKVNGSSTRSGHLLERVVRRHDAQSIPKTRLFNAVDVSDVWGCQNRFLVPLPNFRVHCSKCPGTLQTCSSWRSERHSPLMLKKPKHNGY